MFTTYKWAVALILKGDVYKKLRRRVYSRDKTISIWNLLLVFLKPWNTIAGLQDPGEMRSFTLNYGSGSQRALNSSVA